MRSRIVGLLDGVTLDRAAVFPFVFVPFVDRGDTRVQGNESGVDSRLHVAAMVAEFVLARVQMRQVPGRRRLCPVALPDQDVAAAASPARQRGADSLDAA